MKITWYGHACFRVRERGVTVVMDPYDREIGYTMPRIRADVVTISHGHKGHSCPKGLRGSPRIFDGPGEYEVGGAFITGVPMFHDDVQGRDRGRNVAYLFDFDGLAVCHLGDLGHIPTQSHLEALDGVHVLLVPVGGRSTLGAAQAAEVVGMVEPSIVIPMHYQTEGLSRNLTPVAAFLKAMGVGNPTPVEVLNVSASKLPADRQVAVLSPRQSGAQAR